MNIAEEIDAEFATAVDKLRMKFAQQLGEQNFCGQVAALLLATAIRLAKQGACPRGVLEVAIAARIRVEYGE